jgi:peptide/nickel transport system permease protein
MTGRARRRWSVRIASAVLGFAVILTLVGSALAPHSPNEQFDDRAYAPPTRIHFIDAAGVHAPFMHPLVPVDRLARLYREDESVRIPLVWFQRGLISSSDPAQPFLLFGADALGRDVFSRLLSGAKLSLGVTLVGVLGALLIGGIVGGLAGTVGGWTEGGLMLMADFLLALPGAYLVLVLRGALPRAPQTSQVFLLMALVFSLAAWPHAARGVRAIVATERSREYAEAARASGAGWWRLARQLLPAARGFLAVEVILLVPALLVAEATVSYLGLGFADVSGSWGTMLHDSANGRVLAEAPWLLAPAAAIFIVVLATQLLGGARADAQNLS